MDTERWRQVSRLYHSLMRSDGSGEFLLSDAGIEHLPSFIGRTIGSYLVESLLGAGGMGQVYRARDTRLNRDVALKILSGPLALDARRLARFRQEAQTLASLNHPNIAQIYGIEETDPSIAQGHEIYALVLELVDGPTLADRIARGPLPLDEVLAIARQIADALAAAHDRGIVHRDLKPANISVRPDGTVKVLDFGLAKALASGATEIAPDAESPAHVHSTRGVILGTVPYMAPEQARGRETNARADVWAFGVTLYEMLTGTRPFGEETVADTIAAVLHSEPDWTLVPERLQPLLRRCLEKDPHRRLPTMADVRVWLDFGRSRWRPAPWRAAGLTTAAATIAMALAGASFVYFREAPPEVYPVRFEIPPPPQSTFSNYFVVSPDGRNVAYLATGAEGRHSIWIHSLDRGESTPLIRAQDVSTSSIFWSADSQSIGYVGTDSNIKRIGIAGGPPQTIGPVTRSWGGATWMPDDVIVFGQRTGGLMRVSARGGPPTALTELDPSRQEIGHGGPRMLPDGRHFIYSRASHVDSNTALYVGSIDARPAEQPSQPLLVTDSRPAYAPGRDPRHGHLLLIRDSVLLAQPFDARRLALDGEPVPIAEGVGAVWNGPIAIALASASANEVLAYRHVENTSGMPVWVDRDGREQGLITRDPLTEPESPRISPDGRRIALIVDGDLWVYHADGRPPIKLTFDGNQSAPIWTPDGRRILYKDNPTGNGLDTRIHSVPADRVAAPEIVSPRGHLHPYAWAPDGSLIAAALFSEAGTANITDIDIVKFTPGSDAAVHPVVKTTAREGGGGVALSPDGRWLAYTSTLTGREEVWVQPLAGSEAPVRVSPNSGLAPAWSPRGDELYFFEGSRLMRVSVKATSPFEFGRATTLFENNYLAAGPFYYDVAPDGRFLIIAGGPFFGRSPINVVLNWTRLLSTSHLRD